MDENTSLQQHRSSGARGEVESMKEEALTSGPNRNILFPLTETRYCYVVMAVLVVTTDLILQTLFCYLCNS